MRVVAGTAKGRKLKSRDGKDTRPTTDRLKEALFAMLQFEVPEARFLDLFAGSGGIGIEALSRGAVHCVFVEKSRDAAGCIRENLQLTGFKGSAELLLREVSTAIRALRAEDRQFDIIFMDPPYDKGLEMQTLLCLAENDILAEDGLIVVESSAKTRIEAPPGFEIVKERDHKISRLTFLRHEEPAE